MKDWRGKLFKKGSKVVYPNRTGSSMWMVEAVVQEVGDRTLIVLPTRDSATGEKENERLVTLSATNRVTILD